MIRTSPGAPSPHLVDLRTITVARPQTTSVKKTKKEPAGRGDAVVLRTISGRPNAKRAFHELTIVAFGRFLFAIAKGLIFVAGQIIIAPFTLGLALVDKFDPDRAEPIGNEPAALPIAEPVLFAPRTETKAFDLATAKPRAGRPFNLRRALVSFAGTSLAIILPLQGLNLWHQLETVRAQAGKAQAATVGVLNGTASLAQAEAAITQTRQSVTDLGSVANALLENTPGAGGLFRSGKALLDAGNNLATAATLLSKSLDFINDTSLNLTDKLARAEELAKEAQPLLAAAQSELASADSLPAGVQGDIGSLQDKVAAMNDLTSSFLKIAPALRSILGETQSRRYLVIFQNNAELRPAGGFIGSFALVDVDRGAVTAVQVPAGGSYDLEGSLKANVLSPDPLRLVRAKWEFQDANWFPDFPANAKKLTWFYNQSSGPTVDGVIAVNAPVLADLLDAVGPINMPAYGVTATSTTVLQTAQEIVESPTARAGGKPKQFIADLLPLVLGRIMSGNGSQALNTLSIFIKAMQEKDIQMAFSSSADEQAFDSLGWTGKLAPVPAGFDAFELVRANVAGGKTDTSIKTEIRHESDIDTDGTVTDHVTVTLSHQGKKGDPLRGVRNVEYLRLYVPEGSKLIKAQGDIRPPAASFFDVPTEGTVPDQDLADLEGAILHDPNSGTAINNEFGRTVFGVWTQTDPGTSSTVSFDYQLPFTVQPAAPAPSLGQKIGLGSAPAPVASFATIFEKQSGAINTEIYSTLKLPAGWYPSFASPAGIAALDGWSFTSDLDTDKVIGAMITK